MKVTVENVLPKLVEWSQLGQRVCLATLYYSHGTSPRPVGSQMAIAENGQWFGYLSGGCAEHAISEEGVDVIKQGRNRSVRYGIGSAYLDIQLPCGAGIDVWFDQTIQASHAEAVLSRLASRTLSALQCDTSAEDACPSIVDTSLTHETPSVLPRSSFQRWYAPPRRLYLIGAGPIVVALALLAWQADYSVVVLTPDQHTYNEVEQRVGSVELLKSHSQVEALQVDRWTSLVLMFHEHERETQILTTFLKHDLAYIGALGSKRTHRHRIEQLIENGFTLEQCQRVHGPVGLNIMARTPMEIAISVLAELTLENQQQASPLLSWGGAEVPI